MARRSRLPLAYSGPNSSQVIFFLFGISVDTFINFYAAKTNFFFLILNIWVPLLFVVVRATLFSWLLNFFCWFFFWLGPSGGNVFRLLARREICPRTKCLSKKQWGEAPRQNHDSLFVLKNEAKRDARRGLSSWYCHWFSSFIGCVFWICITRMFDIYLNRM